MPDVLMPPPVLQQIEAMQCPTCGIVYGLEAHYRAKRRDTGASWNCPNGHSLSYRDTEATRLKKQLTLTENCLANTRESLKHMGDRARGAERSVAARKGVVTRMKRKITKGRCVCCSRQFKDLESHMKIEHPKWDPDRGAEAIAEKAVKGMKVRIVEA